MVKTGTRLAFRHDGAMVDPIRRQLLFDFDRAARGKRPVAALDATPLQKPGMGASRGAQDRFLAAVQAEEAGEKQQAIALYEEILEINPRHAAAMINLGTLCFHQHLFGRAEQLYRRATECDPNYALAFFDLGNVLDEMGRIAESIAAYRKAGGTGAALRGRLLQPGAGLRVGTRDALPSATGRSTCASIATDPGPSTRAGRSAAC